MTPALRRALAAVQAARSRLQDIDDAILPYRIAYQEAVSGLAREREMVAAMVDEAERELRAEAEQVFQQTGNKQPVRGVTVKVFTRLQYDPEQARNFCASTPTYWPALAIDRRKFEELAKETPFAFVKSVQVPMATLAKDLPAPTPAIDGDTEW